MTNRLYQKQIGEYLFETYDDRPEFEFDEVKQIHSSVIAKSPTNEEIEADGLISSLTLVTPLAIKTADCLPIVVIGELGVANLHAGWRGLAQGIVISDEIKALRPHTFLIGPHISAKNYEVSEEFKQNFPNSNAFKVIEGRLCFDMQQEVEDQIRKNFMSAQVICANICTFANLNYNSFRRNQTTKRNYNILKRN
ncbi:multi-copper polyphenol oxidoreductase laccase [Halobacteriovorax sp. BALOs_7]|uniref:Laccase domain-containing protein n=1 Tax=Halobacteriovorax vibrionivorans TaxID=2152716 RepID=A0ABY0IJ49_9BACT|nr:MULTISPECIES: polyphenol oxidase family protein [Halobacteriovorax]AYF43545.1 multi-copper polyphenol oxidoreductase laccase [Halobacteriovorax sp. BALOs_7]RZF21886.1 laccase domain-containing protein [Halobacteriovorax vibrionivorans]TGD45829.1 laccase domain-containing protein [Halobacteriovorax sp. Y22]